MHLCADELRLIPLLIPFASAAAIYGRRAWHCACGLCAACLQKLSRKRA